MKRRDFLKSTAAVTSGIFTGLHKAAAHGGAGPVPGPQPNILFILVDELRYPTVFPGDIKTPGEFLANFMPNLYKLWQKGVKFGNHNTAANACTPSRGVLITGLYSQQNWLITTILSTPYPNPPTLPQPVLNPAYPTYGKLLRAAGYQTPYVGKWHVSVPSADSSALDNYGFDYYKSYYDPTGDNLQGTYGDENRGYHNDAYIASQAIDWLNNQRPDSQPWCLTVSFVNPHDKEFFPAGTEFQTYNNLFEDSAVNPSGLQQAAPYPGNGPVVSWDENALKSPKSYGYPAVPRNWESGASIAANKPSTQTFVREIQQALWGGATDDSSQNTATIVQYPNPTPLENLELGVAKMPYSYWQRGLDSYTQVMQIVDGQIGRVLDTLQDLPQNVIENTVIVFASDHGEYSGAHGLLQGKIGTVYEEAWHIPLIVVDPSDRYTGDIDTIRTGLTSHVDFSTLLVSIGNLGTRGWMMGNLARIYRNRHDMISMLKSAGAPGRSYVLYATDEIVPEYFNFNRSPLNVLGLRTEDTKLGLYAKWLPLTSRIVQSSIELEFYDYSTTNGQLELDNTAGTDSRVQSMVQHLLNDLVPNELQQRLPGILRFEQEASKIAHLAYREFMALQPSGTWRNGGLQTLLGYGREF
jgi:arylsulfatase A-like enzyme